MTTVTLWVGTRKGQLRIRPHIRIFVAAQEALMLEQAVLPKDTVHLLCALSGG